MEEGLDKKFKKSISLKEFEVAHTSTNSSMGWDSQEGFDLKQAEKDLNMSVKKLDNFDMEFDMIGYDAGTANALRRILLLDIPSMAIEKVYMYQNSSIMQDDHLSHRLGLIPLNVNPSLFSYPPLDWTPETATETEVLEFSLAIKCSRSKEPGKQSINEKVFTKDMQWVARGEQDKWITPTPGAVAPDILINKLRPGHEMDIKLFAIKVKWHSTPTCLIFLVQGTGRDHAKFSPVATAYYRLLPSITITKPVVGEAAVRLQKCFSPGVIQLVEGERGSKEATVVNQRLA